MTIRGALHVHSTCSDGLLDIPEVVETYERLGFDFLALTDHDFLLREGCYERGLAGLRSRILIFHGVELTLFEKGYVHVNRIQGDREVLHVLNHVADLDLPLPRVLERIEALRARGVCIDAVEITSKGFRAPELDVPEVGLPRLATDDSHSPLGCGRAWIELEAPLDKDSIIRAIKRGELSNGYVSGG